MQNFPSCQCGNDDCYICNEQLDIEADNLNAKLLEAFTSNSDDKDKNNNQNGQNPFEYGMELIKKNNITPEQLRRKLKVLGRSFNNTVDAIKKQQKGDFL